MTSTSENNKRIAKNTLLLYIRMLFLMLISLYTSRVNLSILGVENYGIYNVVGGFVAMFSMISGALSVTISRFITFELGRCDKEKLSRVFSTSVIIQCAMAALVLILIELFGVWFLNNKMNIPPDRMYAANWVLHSSAIAFMVGLISSPYNAVIIAHEKMSAFAYISVLEAMLKLGVVFSLPIIPFDNLIVYALLQLGVAIMMRLVYGIYCKRHFEEAHFRWVKDKKLIKEMLGLIGWAFWGNGAVVLKDQGTNVILNIFCGPAVNAARGIAVQVNSAVYGFTTNFLAAINPQITKSYSSGNVNNTHSLIINGGKYAFFILLILFMPLCANIDYVLSVWLTEVPAHTADFVVLTLLYSLLDCFGHPLVTGVLAEGHIKNYEIVLTFLYVTNVVCSYFMLDLGYEPEWVFVLNIIFKSLVVAALAIHARQKFAFPITRFVKKSVFKCFVVFLFSFICSYYSRFELSSKFLGFVLSSMVIVLLSIAIIIVVGLSKSERTKGFNYIRNKISRSYETFKS